MSRIHQPTSAPTFDGVAFRIAARQQGIVTRHQLLAHGVGRDIIDHRVRTLWLQPIHRGVYRVGPVEAPLSREMAACLACGPDAWLSHRSAGRLWELLKGSLRPAAVEVSLRSGGRRRPGIRTRRVGTLGQNEVTYRHGVPVTTPARTLCDLAADLRPIALEKAVAEGVALRLVSEQELAGVAARHSGRRGIQKLRAVLGGGGPAFTRSRGEELFLELVRRAQVDEPEVNLTIAGHEVDFYWPREQLAIEIDGGPYHSSSRAFERDRRRDADLASRGIRVVRITWRQLTREREAVLVRLGGALQALR
ncbi:MAG TPA: type IV toxin-antitoxin system AbiEi family antitoxin domain-containing protein [Longimicrobiales bacterium]|nr:type IV toxin-antitoxin system AbiEi family antitoxin domain-containing protein [Longimicrobiales bacterium]